MATGTYEDPDADILRQFQPHLELQAGSAARTAADIAACLEGVGIEIGALDSPLPMPKAEKVVYIDILSQEQLHQAYPYASLVLKPDLSCCSS